MKADVLTVAPFYFSTFSKSVQMNQKEIWKDVIGYEGLYQISNLGKVKSLDRYIFKDRWSGFHYYGKILKPQITCGYPTVKLSKNKKYKSCSIHRLIAIHFIPNPENKPQVNHINSIRNDNRIENLEWVTAQENIIHGYKYGYMKSPKAMTGRFGKDNPKSVPVLKISIDNDILHEYDSIHCANRDTNISIGNIHSVCNSKRKTAGGFKWRYKDERIIK